MSFASALERELGAARQIIDANSNSTLTQPPPLNTYRTSYTPNNFSAYTTNSYTKLPFPYIPTPTPTPADTYESKKALNDVKIFVKNLFVFNSNSFSYKMNFVF